MLFPVAIPVCYRQLRCLYIATSYITCLLLLVAIHVCCFQLRFLCVVEKYSMNAKRASVYARFNRVQLDLRVSSRETNSSRVHGLQCHFCVGFGRKEKVCTKAKPSSDVQGWIHPLSYENIENHVTGQHPQKWTEYKLLSTAAERNEFLEYVPVSFKNFIETHFSCVSLCAESEMVFDIVEDIVDVIVSHLMYNPADIADSDSKSILDEPILCSAAERDADLRGRADYNDLKVQNHRITAGVVIHGMRHFILIGSQHTELLA